METNEFMQNEGLIETTKEIAVAESGKGLKMVAGIGLTLLIGGVTYKYLVKPIVVKIKTRKEGPVFKLVKDEDVGYIKDGE